MAAEATAPPLLSQWPVLAPEHARAAQWLQLQTQGFTSRGRPSHPLDAAYRIFGNHY
jgi:hypothetical protein